MSRIGKIVSFLILILISAAMLLATEYGLSKTIYPGCRVVAQIGNILYIDFNKELSTGTDTACEDAYDVIQKITADGYAVVVNIPDYWVPFAGQKFNPETIPDP